MSGSWELLFSTGVLSEHHFSTEHPAYTPLQLELTTAIPKEPDSCSVPLVGCVIRDTYPTEVQYQVLVMTCSAPVGSAAELYRGRGQRWTLEEVFMSLTRYWHFDCLLACRLGVGMAQTHFALLAFTLLGFYQQEQDDFNPETTLNRAPPPLPLPEREVAVYWGPYFALLRPSEIVRIILTHPEVWLKQRELIVQTLRQFEGGSVT